MKTKKKSHPGLTKLPDGRWKIRATAVCQRTGRLKEAVKTLPKGLLEEEVLSQLLNLKAQLRTGETRDSSGDVKLCVSAFAEQWLQGKAARVRPAVAARYEDALGRFILPELGDLLLNVLSRPDVERWVLHAERLRLRDGRHYAKETVQGWWRVLCQLIRDAVAQFNLPIDPTMRVQPPRTPATHRRETRTLTAEEVTKLLDNIRQYAPDRYAEVFVLTFTGMRAGELFALHWNDIDEARGRIHVRNSVWQGNVSTTKTDAPREVALVTEMVEVLREHRRRLVERQHPGLMIGIVFPSDIGTYRTPSSLLKPLALAAEAAGIDVHVTPQVLRRSFNTLMLLNGVDRIVLRSQMGHTSEAMTTRYAGVAIERKQAALAQLIKLTSTPRARG